MNDIAVKVENLGKKYVIGHRDGEYARFNEYLSGLGKSILRRLRNPLKPYDVSLELEDFWAVRNVSFELQKGDRLGIIGHNGSGKSTTLKMLSRITTPTEGRITMHGRIASLLEVGTGFHPELTGRENIYLNGSILGMTRSEIRTRFDEIVDFSGVEKFLDTPVKRYSSGMYVRLAFAVAAHLNPEILVVDEVLSVGDAEFQKKCIGKMQDISMDKGRTILFVSHNMSAIQSLCNKGIVMDHGKMIYCGDVSEAARLYVESRKIHSSVPLAERPRSKVEDCRVTFRSCCLKNEKGELVDAVPLGSKAVFEVEFDAAEDLEGKVKIEVNIYNPENNRLLSLNTLNTGSEYHFRKGPNKIAFTVPKMPLFPGSYNVQLFAEKDSSIMTVEPDALFFQTLPGCFHNPDILSQSYNSMIAVDYSVETE